MKVIVAIDGSKQSQLIVHNLNAFAPCDNILLLHAFHVPQLAYPGTGMSVGHEFSNRAEEALRKEGLKILEDICSQLPKNIGPIHQQIERGTPADVILSTAEQEKADLIVIASRGLGVIREKALGSVSHRVVTHAPCSTLVVKDGCETFQKILIPLQHKTDAERIVSFLSRNPFRGQVHLTLLHVIPFAQPVLPVGALIPESLRKNLIEEGEQWTNEIAKCLNPLGYETATIVKAGSPSLVIHEEASKLNANLIVMKRQKKDTLSRFLLGSVSHSVIHHGTSSVLLLK